MYTRKAPGWRRRALSTVQGQAGSTRPEGEETNGAISIIEQPFEPGLLLPPHVHENHENDVWLYMLEGRCTPGLATRSSGRRPVAGC
jgi:quercetin dioxygenase-like cupin family protein